LRGVGCGPRKVEDTGGGPPKPSQGPETLRRGDCRAEVWLALISLTTDFGLDDGYVGTMKAVMAGIAPGVPTVDITHTIAPQDVAAAAYVLWTSLPYFPPQSVHLVVVDPGVGTSRRAVASATAWGILVGPDNGVFSYVWHAAPPQLTVALEASAYQRASVSRTFHGRDIFAPAAAHIAAGVPLAAFGPEVEDPVRLPMPRMTMSDEAIHGEVIYIDRFGNAITSIGRMVWDGWLLRLDPVFADPGPRVIQAELVTVWVGGHAIGSIRRTYGEVAPGKALALVGSEGLLEIATHGGHGARELGLAVGDPVEITAI
jgi:S-adenosyl-L-methionine hydrolase (adenosine-forming)